ncbi:hypothetical protein BCCR75502_02561 [Burkholderia sola]|nr:hypothetical protein BCCR75389_02547 [Burkholderia cenocepacia]CAG2287340.1 hypothetical protein BCCR75386_02558 [Burkholderia cenocepacia]CAG2287725.1 hypothetical protein BCCR75388_02563 [Burkholderia cenocepacia]CAG2287881.1 hypothetical protein BCCR75384_02560 [Burkholderia cenocepacia]CAG2287983.1 hypothetical protein BCCR75387_02559 [Burkholderia cenocepacia]
MHGSGLDIGPHCPNGSTQKCVMSLICIRLNQTKQTVSGCLAQFGHQEPLLFSLSMANQRRVPAVRRSR